MKNFSYKLDIQIIEYKKSGIPIYYQQLTEYYDSVSGLTIRFSEILNNTKKAELLKTIQLPRNFKFLKERLPKV